MSWRLDKEELIEGPRSKDVAQFESAAWRLSCDLSNPSRGLKVEPRGNASSDSNDCEHIFGAALLPKLEHASDRYCRGSDLVVRYEATSERNFAIQFDYRVIESSKADRLVVDLWVSVQTHLLDSHPSVAFDFPSMRESDRLFQVDPVIEESKEFGDITKLPTMFDLIHQVEPLSLAIGKRENGDHTNYVAVLLHPSDQEDASWSRATSASSEGNQQEGLRVKLFGDFMEKGVIRRARMRFIATASPFSLGAITKAFLEFARSPLPLDT